MSKLDVILIALTAYIINYVAFDVYKFFIKRKGVFNVIECLKKGNFIRTKDAVDGDIIVIKGKIKVGDMEPIDSEVGKCLYYKSYTTKLKKFSSKRFVETSEYYVDFYIEDETGRIKVIIDTNKNYYFYSKKTKIKDEEVDLSFSFLKKDLIIKKELICIKPGEECVVAGVVKTSKINNMIFLGNAKKFPIVISTLEIKDTIESLKREVYYSYYRALLIIILLSLPFLVWLII